MSRKNLESVAEAQRIAQKRLPKSIYLAVLSGIEKGQTREANVTAFDEIGLIPRIADLGDVHEQATHVLGQDLSFPVITSPVGAQALRPEGELAVARATKAAGTTMGLSNFATKPIEEVIRENPNALFQLYWYGDRDNVAARVDRAREAGAKGLILTLDWALTSRRDWGTPKVPVQLDLKTLLSFAPEGLTHPAWLLDFLLHGGLPDLKAPNTTPAGVPPQPFAAVYPLIGSSKQHTWDDIAWVRTIWDGPLVIKGITHPDDAQRAADIGATAISVSNHGGNNIDSTPPSIRVLPAIAEKVGDQVEVLLDGGIRRGGDVVKALALGAKAVLIGRGHLYPLIAGGEAGVRQILEVLRTGIHENLLALGKASVHDLTPDDVLLPEGFAIRRFPQSLLSPLSQQAL